MRPQTSFHLLALGVLFLALCSVGCGGAKTSGPVSVAVSNHLAAISAAGEPVTLEQLGRIYGADSTETVRFVPMVALIRDPLEASK
jgi:hypothetical protein